KDTKSYEFAKVVNVKSAVSVIGAIKQIRQQMVATALLNRMHKNPEVQKIMDLFTYVKGPIADWGEHVNDVVDVWRFFQEPRTLSDTIKIAMYDPIATALPKIVHILQQHHQQFELEEKERKKKAEEEAAEKK